MILIVIRDHVGATPLENLAKTLRADLEKIWEGLSKVPDDDLWQACENGQLTFMMDSPKDWKNARSMITSISCTPAFRTKFCCPKNSRRKLQSCALGKQACNTTHDEYLVLNRNTKIQ